MNCIAFTGSNQAIHKSTFLKLHGVFVATTLYGEYSILLDVPRKLFIPQTASNIGAIHIFRLSK
jgi:hypothetical protein